MVINNGTDSPDSSTASPPAVDGDSKMESKKSDYIDPGCGPQSDSNSINDGISSGDAESVNQGVPSDLPAKTNQCTKVKAQWCSWIKALIIFLLVALVLLTLFTAVLGWYVIDRLDGLEQQCNSGLTTLLVNNTQLNLELGDGDLQELIVNLSKEVKEMRDNISTLKQTMQTTHENDIDQIRMNVSTILTQVNTSLSTSLLFFTTDAATNISSLKREIFSVQNHSITLAQNVSALLDQVSRLETRSDELETNATAFKSSINKRLTSLRLTVNMSSNERLLRAVSTTQEGHTAMIEQIKRNTSLLEDRFDQQLSDMREHLTTTLSDFNSSLSQIDTSHRDRLRILSSHLNNLDDELVTAKEEFRTNMSLLREELTELSEALDLDSANDNLTDLESALANVKEIHSSNISAIRQGLIHLSEELGETNEHLENLSSIQDGLRRDFILTNKLLQSNISTLEQTLNGELNHKEVQLQNQDNELWISIGSISDRLKANISTLQESHGHLQGDVGHTKAKLQTLSSQHVDLQSDYNATKRAFYTTKAAMERNVTQLHALILNHSWVLGEHSRRFDDAAQNISTLLNRISDTSNLVRSHDALISGIRSNMTLVQNRMTGLHDTLNININSLNSRIDDHVDWIQHSLDGQSQRLTDFDSRIHDVEQKVENDAVQVVPLGFLLLSVIALLICYFTL